MQELSKRNRLKVVDLLTERLTFERAGVKLYDAVIAKVSASGDAQVQEMIEQLQEHRNEEKEHEEWLEAQLRDLGADTNGITEMSDLVMRESRGIEDVILDGDNEILHNFHALLTAELADNAGWDLLVELADEAGDRPARKAFKKLLHEEEEHLIFMRRAVQKLARREFLGQQVAMPTAP